MPSPFLCVLILRCEDPDSVARWYRNTLGLPLEKRGHEFSCLSGQTHFAIHGLQPGQSPTGNAELGFYFSDLDTLVKGLRSKETELVDPIRDYPWARSAQIKDPLGNSIYLMELPAATIKEIGAHLASEFSF